MRARGRNVCSPTDQLCPFSGKDQANGMGPRARAITRTQAFRLWHLSLPIRREEAVAEPRLPSAARLAAQVGANPRPLVDDAQPEAPWLRKNCLLLKAFAFFHIGPVATRL